MTIHENKFFKKIGLAVFLFIMVAVFLPSHISQAQTPGFADMQVYKIGNDGTTNTGPGGYVGAFFYGVWDFRQDFGNSAYWTDVTANNQYGVYSELPFDPSTGQYITTVQAGSCTYPRGGSECAVTSYNLQCFQSFLQNGECLLNFNGGEITLEADTVTKVVFNYADTRGDVKIYRVGGDDTTFTAPSTSAGVNAGNQNSTNPADFINLSSAPVLVLSDSSGNNFTPTAVGNPSEITGAVGQAIGLNGSTQYMVVPNNSALSFSGDFTISTWLKVNTDSSGAGTSIVAKHNSGASTGYVFFYYNNRLILQFGNGSSWPASDVRSSTVIPQGSWQYVTVTRSGGTVKFYLNGTLDSTGSTISTAIPDSGGDMWIGHDVNQSNVSEHHLNGGIDDLKMYSRALSAEEVSGLYSNSNPTTSGLQAYYTMDSVSSVPATYTVYSTDAALFSEVAGTCTYSRGANECSVTNFNLTPTCSGGQCTLPVTVTSGTVTKVVFKYSSGTYNLTIQDPSMKVTPGHDVSTTIRATNASTSPLLVSLAASGLPAGAVATFNQTSCFASCDTVLNIDTASSTPIGTYTITITGNPNGVISTFNLEVTNQNDAQISFCWLISDGSALKTNSTGIPSGSFSINLARSFNIAQSTLNTITLNSQNFTPNTTYFSGNQNNAQCMSVTNLAYRHYTYSAATVTGSNWGTVKYHDSVGGAPASTGVMLPYSNQLFDANPTNDGSRTLASDGHIIFTAGVTSRSILILNTYTGTSTQATSTVPVASCNASYSSAPLGTTIRWSGNVNRVGSYTYGWTGTDSLSASTLSVSKKYTTTGTKTGTFRVYDGPTIIGTCTKTVNITDSSYIEY